MLDIDDNDDDIDQADPETGEALEDNIVEDTPLLINIKGCGYPPEVNCDDYADKYYNHSLVGREGVCSNNIVFYQAGQTFPCHYSRMNPWIVLSDYSKYELSITIISDTNILALRDDNVTSVLSAILIPNGLFVLSIIVLVYW